MQYTEIVALIGDTLDRLHRSNVIKHKIAYSEDTVLIGENSELDSLAFVTFISDMEELISDKTGRDIFFDLDEVADFSSANPFISARDFANYVTGLIARPE